MTNLSNPTDLYIFDAKASQFTVQAFSGGLGGIADHRPEFAICDFWGNANLPDLRLQDSSFNVKIDPASFSIKDEVSARDRRMIERLMFDEILEIKKFPEIEFKSTQIVPTPTGANRHHVRVAGTLSLHGVSKQHLMEAQIVATDTSLRAYGEFRVRQTDYGIKLASVAGGAIRIKDELKFVFYIVAVKQSAL